MSAPDSGSEKDLAKFKDVKSISNWSKTAIMTVVSKGVMLGNGVGFEPLANITRAEALTIAARMDTKAYAFMADTKGTYKQADVKGNGFIKVADVTLSDVVITGNLTIGSGVGNGDVILKNVRVGGKLFVLGGGVNSIHVENSTLGGIVVAKQGDPVRVSLEGTTTTSAVRVLSDSTIQNSTATPIGTVEVTQPATVTVAGNVGTLAVDAPATLTVASGTIGTLDVNSTSSTVAINQGAAVTTADISQATTITGSGTIGTMTATAPVTTSITPTTVTPGSATVTPTTPAPAPVAVGGGGGGGGAPSPIAVTAITLSQTALETVTNAATTTLTATVAPSNATDKSLTWTSSNTGIVTVTNGVLECLGRRLPQRLVELKP
jgi:hypothetical protein